VGLRGGEKFCGGTVKASIGRAARWELAEAEWASAAIVSHAKKGKWGD